VLTSELSWSPLCHPAPPVYRDVPVGSEGGRTAYCWARVWLFGQFSGPMLPKSSPALPRRLQYQRLVGEELVEQDRANRQDVWGEQLGLRATPLGALDATQLKAARVEARGHRVAFEAGLRAGAAIGGLQGPTRN
jgi:hypothetical protein